jgi:hypothetical protein
MTMIDDDDELALFGRTDGTEWRLVAAYMLRDDLVVISCESITE